MSLLVLSIVSAPVEADTQDGITLLLFVPTEGAGEGDIIEINAEAYKDGALVDLDALNVQVGLYPTAPVAMTNGSTGKWSGSVAVDRDYTFAERLPVSAHGNIGSTFLTVNQWVDLDLAPKGWELSMHIVNIDEVGTRPSLGSHVVVEARSYLDGVLTEGGPINASLSKLEAGSTTPTEEDIAMEQQAPGVYQVAVDVPASITRTTSLSLNVELGPGGSLASEYTGYVLHPFPADAYLTDEEDGSAVVHVLARPPDNPPLCNTIATVLDVTDFDPHSKSTEEGPNGTLDADGRAAIPVTWQPLGPGGGYVEIDVNLTTSAGTAVFTLTPSLSSPFDPWLETDGGPDCSLTLVTEADQVELDREASLTFLFEQDEAPVNNQFISLYLWNQGETSAAFADQVKTNAAGEVTVQYHVSPSDFFVAEGKAINAEGACPSGAGAAGQARFGLDFTSFSSPNLEVTITGQKVVGGKLHVKAKYTGDLPDDNARAHVTVVPETIPGAIVGTGGTVYETATLYQQADGSFEGDITVPEWWGEGDYTISALVTNHVAVTDPNQQFEEGAFSSYHFAAASNAGDGGDGGNVGGSLLPGLGALETLAAVGAVSGLLAVRRRGGRR